MLFSFASPSRSPQGQEPVVDTDLQDDRDQVREEIGATLSALMPWGVSIGVHMLLVVLAFFLVWQTIVPQEEQTTVPTLGRIPHIKAPSQTSMEKAETSAASSSSSMVPIVKPVNEVKPLAPGFKRPPIAVPVPGQGIGQWDKGVGTGKKKGPFGVGDDDDGEGGGGSNEIVFVVDASGSMVDVLPFVVNELKRVVNTELGKEQQATVLFFSGSGVFEMPGGKGLREVTPAFKTRFDDWATLSNHQFKTGGRGSAYVEKALTTALRYQPQVVYLLSDNLTGGGQGATQHELFQDALIDLIIAHNKSAPPARISTIQFLYEDPLVRAGLTGTLQRIAEETGGQFKFLTQQDLNLR